MGSAVRDDTGAIERIHPVVLAQNHLGITEIASGGDQLPTDRRSLDISVMVSAGEREGPRKTVRPFLNSNHLGKESVRMKTIKEVSGDGC